MTNNLFALVEHNCNERRINDASIGIRRELLVACSRTEHQLQLWQHIDSDTIDERTINVITSPECVALSNDEHHLAYGSVSGAVKIIDVTTGIYPDLNYVKISLFHRQRDTNAHRSSCESVVYCTKYKIDIYMGVRFIR